MNLKTLLASWSDLNCDDDLLKTPLNDLILDHRELLPGDVFVALQGHHRDARVYIQEAIAAGAQAVISDAGDDNPVFYLEIQEADFDHGVPIVSFPFLKSSLSQLAGRFYQDPSSHMTLLGVTGTNGKTTVSQLMAQWIDLLGYKAAVMGTTGNGFLLDLEPAINTTADPVLMQKKLSHFYQAGATHVALEVSSHGLVQKRVDGIAFDAVVFTNLSRDHLDYHGTMQAYAQAKKRLLTDFDAPVLVINADDPVGSTWLNEIPNAIGVSMSAKAPCSLSRKYLYLTSVKYASNGVTLTFSSSQWGAGEFSAPLVGEFNVMNLLLSLATLLSLGFDKKTLLQTAPKLHPVIGRMEVYHSPNKPMFVVDYAHTPDALEKALHALRRHCSGSLWCVFGCGGDRDAGKRPLMAEIAERFADKVLLTDDNPRSESPEHIVSQMLNGMKNPKNAIVLHDRKKACRYAFENASENDVILVAGKGHEDYQVLKTGRVHYSDRETVHYLLEEKE